MQNKKILFFLFIFGLSLVSSTSFHITSSETISDVSSATRYLLAEQNSTIDKVVFELAVNYTNEYSNANISIFSDRFVFSDYIHGYGIYVINESYSNDSFIEIFNSATNEYSGNVSIPENCLAQNNLTLNRITYMPPCGGDYCIQVFRDGLSCFNGTDYQLFVDSMGMFYYRFAYDYLNRSERILYNNSLTKEEIYLTQDLSSYVNNISSDCNCYGCIKNGSSCGVPFYFEFPNYVEFFYNISWDMYLEEISGGGVLVVIGDGGIPPIKQVYEVFIGGGSFKSVAETYNPEIYPLISDKFNELISKENFEDFSENLWDLFVLFLKYLFRQPASLVSEGGINHV